MKEKKCEHDYGYNLTSDGKVRCARCNFDFSWDCNCKKIETLQSRPDCPVHGVDAVPSQVSPSPDNPCFCDCHLEEKECLDCRCGRHKTKVEPPQPDEWVKLLGVMTDDFDTGLINKKLFMVHAGNLIRSTIQSTVEREREELVRAIFKKMDEYEYHKDEVHCTCLGALREYIKDELLKSK